MTLGDEIRSMNDEELADYMAKIFTTLLANMDAEVISNGLFEILKQEVEE
jgi:hypothetical protein